MNELNIINDEIGKELMETKINLKGFNFENLVRVELKNKASVIRETLSRMGIGSHEKKTLWQTCHLIKIDRFWYIIHYKEVYGLRGQSINWREGDLERRNEICNLLEQWGLLKISNPNDIYFSYGENISTDPIKIYKIRNDEKESYTIKKKIHINELKDQLDDYNEELRTLDEQ